MTFGVAVRDLARLGVVELRHMPGHVSGISSKWTWNLHLLRRHLNWVLWYKQI
jgi:hypothetical protein